MKRIFNLKRAVTIVAVLSFHMVMLAQNETDALRYSFLEPLGSARYTSMGGAFGALGGDLSAVSWNPAASAIYRRNEVSGSFSLAAVNSSALYADERTDQSAFPFHLPQIGIVSNYETQNPAWGIINLSIGYNKLRNFNQSTNISGDVEGTSLIDVFLAQANGTNFDELNMVYPFSAGLGWNTFLIDTVSSSMPNTYFSANPNGMSRQLLRDEVTGHMGETVVNLGANYLDEWYFGLTLGFPVVRYNRDYQYTENVTDPDANLESFTYRDELITTGNGINIKLGAIYRATNWLRLGAAWHSGTVLSMNDSWDTEVISNFRSGEQFSSFAQGAFDYNVRTPGRWIAGAAFILGKNGLISADYEFVDYSRAELRPSNLIPNSTDFSAENAVIDSVFTSSHNARIGGEWRIRRDWRLRAGFVYQQSPYINSIEELAENIITYSGGFGYRGEQWFFEGAYQHRASNRVFYMYDPSLVDAAQIDSYKGEFLFTIGFRY